MGSTNLDRVPLYRRRSRCESVGEMIAQAWDVHARCRTCGLVVQVDLRVIAVVKGPGFSLWNRYSRCRRIGCAGVVDFTAKAPGMAWHEDLKAPDHEPPPVPFHIRAKGG